MRRTWRPLTETTKFSPVHTKGGKYYKRRAKDSKILVMKAADAKKWAKKPGGDESPGGPNDPLAIWYVPPEYVKVKEGKWRIKTGWIRPIWSWEFGPQKGGVRKG
jgi:hypothetical protein